MELSKLQRIILFLLSLGLAVGFCSLPAKAADEPGYVLRSDVREVRMAFSVRDAQGRTVPDLRPADVAVADNGRIIRRFRSFRPASEAPLDVVILLDASDSVATHIAEEVEAVRRFVAASSWRAQDRVSILTFGGLHWKLLCAQNCRDQQAERELGQLQPQGTTPLYDAMHQAAELLLHSATPETRPAMVLFSDGVDTISIHGAPEVVQAAQELECAIYTVNSRSRRQGAGHGEDVMEYFSEGTGGMSFLPGGDAQSALQLVLEDLRSGYLLTYELPERTGGEHKVRMLATANPRLSFRSRQAYREADGE
jgi:VWFA-related protein